MSWTRGMTFFRNLHILRHKQPELAEKLERFYPQVKAEPDGAQAIDIRRELDWSESELKACDREDLETIIVCGFWPVVHAKRFVRRLPESVIFYEPRLELLAKALSLWDLRYELAQAKVCADLNYFERHFEHFWNPYKSTAMVVHPGFKNDCPEELQRLEQTIDSLYKRRQLSLTGYLARSKIMFANILENLPNYWHLPSVFDIEESLCNIPAIIVAAGPSLDKNIHLLKRVRGRAVVFAVGTVLQKLDRLGITPNFATAVEVNNILYQFEGLSFLSELNLILNVAANRKLFLLPVKRKIIVANTEPLNRGIQHLLNRDIVGDFGGTVASTAFIAARKMGANPIIFIGQDLALGEAGVSHAQGLRNRESLTDEELEAIRTGKGLEELDLFYVDGYYGNRVLTRSLWYTYLRWYEVQMDNIKVEAIRGGRPLRVINATEGGARIEGMEQMPFAEAIERFCHRKIDVEAKIEGALYGYRPPNPKGLIVGLKKAMATFKQLAQTADAAVVMCELVQSLIERRATTSEIVEKLKALDNLEKRMSLLSSGIDPVLDMLMRHELVAHATDEELHRGDEVDAFLASLRESRWMAMALRKNARTAYKHLLKAITDLETGRRGSIRLDDLKLHHHSPVV